MPLKKLVLHGLLCMTVSQATIHAQHMQRASNSHRAMETIDQEARSAANSMSQQHASPDPRLSIYLDAPEVKVQEVAVEVMPPSEQINKLWEEQEAIIPHKKNQMPQYLTTLVQTLSDHPETTIDSLEILIATLQAAQCHALFAENKKPTKETIALYKDTMDKLVKAEITFKNPKVYRSIASNQKLLETVSAALPQSQITLEELYKIATRDPRNRCEKIKDFFPEKYKELKNINKHDLKFWTWSSGRAKTVCETLLIANLFFTVGRGITMYKTVKNEGAFDALQGLAMADYLMMTSFVTGQYMRQKNWYPNSFVRVYGIANATYIASWIISQLSFYGK